MSLLFSAESSRLISNSIISFADAFYKEKIAHPLDSRTLIQELERVFNPSCCMGSFQLELILTRLLELIMTENRNWLGCLAIVENETVESKIGYC